MVIYMITKFLIPIVTIFDAKKCIPNKNIWPSQQVIREEDPQLESQQLPSYGDEEYELYLSVHNMLRG